MAKKHILSLEIPTVANCEIFTIWDTSEYADELAVDCPTLSVTAPGFQNPMSIEQDENFHRDFSTCAFGLQTVDCGGVRHVFPDGIYVIRWSVSPHDKVYVEYNHMRITTILSAYYEKLCEIEAKPCEPSSDMISLMSEMKYIRTLIDAAKAKVEYCHEPNAGMELYEYAKMRLEKITCEVICCK
tara:strand:+ start:1236 stop:1790 length:555 start_codon:yes stop_codon:yes gene_type:complete